MEEKRNIDFSHERTSEFLMDLYQRAKLLLKSYNIFPRRKLSQNFMIDIYYLKQLLTYAEIDSTDIILEIGPGLGFLTKLLAQYSKKVIAVEIDKKLIKVLKNEIKSFNNIELIEGNIFNVTLPPFNKIVSNPPFSSISELMIWLFNRNFESAIFTMQREFTNHLNASVGTREYNSLTVITNYNVSVKIVGIVERDAFFPQPEVDIVIVKLVPKRIPPFEVKDRMFFFEVVKTLFTQRNRKLRNAIKPLLNKFNKLTIREAIDLIPFANKRVREIAPEGFGELVNELWLKENIH